MSTRESVLAAAAKALSGTKSVGTNIFRSRTDAIAGAEMPSIVVLPESETPSEQIVNGPVDVRLTFVVEVFAHADSVAEKSADTVCASAYSKLMSDPTLGGLLIDLSEVETLWDHDQSDQALVIVTMRFAAWYRRNRAALT